MTQTDLLEELLRPRISEFGITRVADTTGLDRTGIPTASAVKPGTPDVIWVYSGKALTQARARALAIMECLERTCALWPPAADPVIATREDLERDSSWPTWGAERFTEGRWPRAAGAPIPWVTGETLDSNNKVWIPADLVYTGHRPVGLDAASPFRVRTSNGLAASLDIGPAIEHGLFEIAERDIVSHYEMTASHAGVSYLAAVGKQFGIDIDWLEDSYRDDISRAVTIDLNTIPPTPRALADRFIAAGFELVVKALPNDFGLPAFGAACMEPVTFTQVLGCAGYAARATPEEALTSALLELAQTRATDLQGAREDRSDIEKRRLPHTPSSHWLATPSTPVSYDDASTMFPAAARQAETHASDAFKAAGLTDIAIVEFPSPPGISAVRVVVPGAETWHSTGGEASLGPRLAKMVNRG